MGFNKRKMEAQRAAAAEKKAAARRAAEAQVLEDAGRLVAAWNDRQAKRMPMLFSPTIGYWPFSTLPGAEWFFLNFALARFGWNNFTHSSVYSDRGTA
jgi:hypothetical protein